MRRRDVLLALPAWPVVAQAQVQGGAIATSALEAVPERIAAAYGDVRSVVVRQQGRELLEHHAAGGGAETLHDVQSVTKSVLSLLVGVALGEGRLRALDQPVAELLPAVRDAEAAETAEAAAPGATTDARLTVRHLLTMTAGYRAEDRFAPGVADDAAAIVRRPRRAPPGAAFGYDNLASNLLALALEAAIGERLSSYASRVLLQPLGIGDFRWETGSRGHTLGFSGLRLRTRDMARIGQLMLQHGHWHGQAVVPEAYARAAVTAQNAGGAPVGLAYGYLWWVVPQGPEPRVFLASGWGGQLIWVHPGLQLVIAITCAVSAESNRRGQAIGLLRNVLLPALQGLPREGR